LPGVMDVDLTEPRAYDDQRTQDGQRPTLHARMIPRSGRSPRGAYFFCALAARAAELIGSLKLILS
jgi:hypothetical protein